MFGSRSFTLVELVVTIGIILLVTGFVIPNLADFRGQRALTRTAAELRNKLLETQALALAPRASDANLVGYGFFFNTGTGQYGIALILANPRTVISQINGNPAVIESTKLPSSTTFGQPNVSHNGSGIHQLDFLAGERASAEVISSSSLLKTGTLRIPLIQESLQKTIVVQLPSGSVTIE